MSFNIPQKIQNFFGRYPDALDVFVTEQGDAYLNSAEQKAMRKAISANTVLHRVSKNLSSEQIYPEPVIEPQFTLRYDLVVNGDVTSSVEIPENGLVNMGSIPAGAVVNIYLSAVVGNILITGLSYNGNNTDKINSLLIPGTSVTQGNQILIATMNLEGVAAGSYTSIIGVNTNAGIKSANLTYELAAPVTYTYQGQFDAANAAYFNCNGDKAAPAEQTAQAFIDAMAYACQTAGVSTQSINAGIDNETGQATMTIVSLVQATFVVEDFVNGNVTLTLQ